MIASDRMEKEAFVGLGLGALLSCHLLVGSVEVSLEQFGFSHMSSVSLPLAPCCGCTSCPGEMPAGAQGQSPPSLAPSLCSGSSPGDLLELQHGPKHDRDALGPQESANVMAEVQHSPSTAATMLSRDDTGIPIGTATTIQSSF